MVDKLSLKEKEERLKKLLEREKTRIPILLEVIEKVTNLSKDTQEKGLEHFTRINNVILFVSIVEMDMSVLLFHYARNFDENWEQKLTARQLALLTYEISFDIPQLLNKDFRISLESLPLWDGADKELNAITKSLHKFQETKREKLKEIRLYSIGHREKDSLKQIEIINKIDPDEIYLVVVDFYTVFTPLVNYLLEVSRIMANPRVILHHLSEAIEKEKNEKI